MAKKPTKKRTSAPARPQLGDGVEILSAGVVLHTPITETLETNYMPYAMSVIVSRALPEIDGFKPAHRKLLYTMYDMGLLKGARTKSATIVGSTMHLNPHGDAAIYETMVRMGRGNESLLVPFVDSKGNFGKAYSRDMAYAASRYTEARLEPVCEELFRDIDKDTVDFVPNYDGSTTEPTLLPVTFPTILANNTLGIAVGMASNICSFNLSELCQATVALMKDEQADLSVCLPAPDFVGGGQILYDAAEMQKVYEYGRGSIRVRAVYRYEKEGNRIEVTQIPPTTTVEAIMDKIADLVKAGRIKEISDMRDETDLNGLKLTIDLKRGQDPDKLMQKLYKATPMEDSFACNFNVLVGGQPRVMGVREILREWVAFRTECVRRRTYHDLQGKKKRMHLLRGLEAILLDIDKAIDIVRNTEEESEVVPNLMIGFGIDEVQAEYVAEIKLRHLNREYILKRTAEIEELEKEIARLEDILASKARMRRIIVDELNAVAKKYGKPRRSEIVYDLPDDEGEEETAAMADYPVVLFFTREGYFKKIIPQSLRMSGEQKLKEGDEVTQRVEAKNDDWLLFFTNHQQVYKCRAGEFDDTKASVLGDYVANRLGMDEGELPVYMAVTAGYEGHMLFFFESGKCAKVAMESYATKQNRKKLLKAYSAKEALAAMLYLKEETELAIRTTGGRMLLVGSAQISAKTTRDSAGVAVITLKRNQKIAHVGPAEGLELADPHRYRVRTLPAAGAILRSEDTAEQLKLGES
ncbi:MAG: topoisomerase IV [Oscillospiraceae bacterium]|nr:topoisomerase IV [Oscillospiraceae bacterium]